MFSKGKLLADTGAARVLNSPELVKAASLKITSLYSLSNACGLANPQAFTEAFIARERRMRSSGQEERKNG